MNRNLLVFGLLLVVTGIFVGFYVISIFGLLMLVPALMASPRPPPSPPVSRPARETPGTIIPPLNPQPTAEQPARQGTGVSAPAIMMASTPSSQSQSYFSPALFPGTLLPSLSLSMGTPKTTSEPTSEGPARGDEVVEVGAILALVRLLLG
ncbi:MAG: hypothetical protein JRN71_05895 [Nitrososphaerota archaeon]|nr:hypothetical protein [Nitrososphaerota archaeon]MDG6956815.1 hypothetical protein [Nitrososphaerota archaeon]MDG6987279.1 hypothetical protein [Nitrososphaerota archaeon]